MLTAGLSVAIFVWSPPSLTSVIAMLIAAGFTAFISKHPFPIRESWISLTHVVALGTGLIYGPAAAIGSLLIGFPLGVLLSGLLPDFFPNQSNRQSHWRNQIVALGLDILPLALMAFLFGWRFGIEQRPEQLRLSGILIMVVVYSLFYTAFLVIDTRFGAPGLRYERPRNLPAILLVESLSLPFILIAVAAFPSIGLGALAALGAIATLVALLLNVLGIAQSDLERRLLDLDTLENVSRVLRSTIDMDNLLTIIHQQVSQLLGTESFYVALYDENVAQIWYPIAVKKGKRRDWPPRSFADRLTDRVIQEGQPILLARQAKEALSRIGLPTGEEALNAWLGVPLITPKRTIGCLAVFSASPETEFTESDQNLLTILSGQVSVAIDNALLFEQARKRATQLENLNQISALISASLDLDEVLAKVCQAAIQVAGGQMSAIYLLAPDASEISLAHSTGLSHGYVADRATGRYEARTISRCLQTGEPYLVNDIRETSLDANLVKILVDERIHSFGDFPLTVPDGQIGYLSVYFDAPHRFSQEELELLNIFAAQAALAVSNARLYAHTDLALSQRVRQLSILETIGREISAVTYSDELFHMILDYGLEFTNASWGSLVLHDAVEQNMVLKASRGYRIPEDGDALNSGITRRVIQEEKPLLVADVSLDPDYVDLTAGSAKSQLSAPLIREGQVVGVLTLESPQVHGFDQNDQAFLSQLANQAAIAVVNAELYQETQQRLREQTNLYRISAKLAGNLELDDILGSIEQGIHRGISASTTAIYRWDQAHDCYVLHSLSSRETEPKHEPFPEQLSGEQVRHSFPDLPATGWLQIAGSDPRLAAIFLVCHTCHVVLIPLMIFGDSFGLIISHVENRQPIQENSLRLLEAISAQGAIALQNAVLFEDLARAKNRLETVLNSVGEGILLLDLQGNINLINAPIETLTHTPAEQLNGHNLLAVPEQALGSLGYSRQQAAELVQSLEKGLVPAMQKTVIQSVHSGPEKMYERISAPVWGQNDRIIGIILVIRDVTEEYEINQARELITQTIVHDLKSPMGTIQNALELIDETTTAGNGQDGVVAQSLSIANRATQRVLSLVDALLDIAKMQSGEMEVILEDIDLRETIDQLVVDFLPQAQAIGVILRTDIDPGLTHLRVDRIKFNRILTNLIDNALKFTPTGKQILIAARPEGSDRVRLHVADHGPGIPEEYREKIFERFTQVPGRNGRRRGSGLGLTFCRLAVEAHGGRIWVEPNGDDGSIFAFTLPRESGPA